MRFEFPTRRFDAATAKRHPRRPLSCRACEELLPPQRSWFRSVVYTPALAHPVIWCALVLLWTLVWSVRRLLSHRAGCPISLRELCAGKAIQVLAGVLGLLLLAMWALTDHRDTWGNWNMLWASPLLPLLWFLPSGRWLHWFRWILSVGVVGFLLLFIFVPNSFPTVPLSCCCWAGRLVESGSVEGAGPFRI